jgi:hypothetical protein
MNGNNIDIDKGTLKRLSDLAFSVEPLDEEDLVDSISNIVNYSSSPDEISEKIVLLFKKTLKDRSNIFSKYLSNPIAVLKPKKPMFYRIE